MIDNNVANIKLSTKVPNEKRLVRKTTASKRGRTIIETMKDAMDISNMSERYAGKAILTPPFFNWL
jgi:hypothetical protein